MSCLKICIVCLQSINEDSLKRLNSYLEDIQKKKPVNPTHLMFYLKNDTVTPLEEGISQVHINPFNPECLKTIQDKSQISF